MDRGHTAFARRVQYLQLPVLGAEATFGVPDVVRPLGSRLRIAEQYSGSVEGGRGAECKARERGVVECGSSSHMLAESLLRKLANCSL